MKRRTVLAIGATVILTYGLLYLIGSTWVPPVYTVQSEITLPASARRSWEVLTDFAQYPQWNPYLPRVEGALEPGQAISFTLVDGNFSEPMELGAQIGGVNPPEELYWEGTLGIQGLHDTRHVFRLIALDNGDTQLKHFEEFRGLLPMVLPDREQRTTHTRRAFEGMNRALQQRLAN
jgi:hypothetical protein